MWRLYADVNESLRERAERLSLRIVGFCFLVLALYISYDSIALLVRQRAPERSVPGDHAGVRVVDCDATWPVPSGRWRAILVAQR